MLIQQKTGSSVQFELTSKTRDSLQEQIAQKSLRSGNYLFGSRVKKGFHLTTREYAKIVKKWISSTGLDITLYGTHFMRRTKASLIYNKIKN